ncbi:hypothetical protein CYMTET_36059 [Cymbomonas tetramitiformis]|uniref:Uncharacterized protein n=1 Tax=Cymbomonas tetramitiformis TaxID=36881 RepID=A0AAE0F805_9CHLO|nr:hypothetical protein CYMTET_36059 [Cymbomonas tetramitiformis]
MPGSISFDNASQCTLCDDVNGLDCLGGAEFTILESYWLAPNADGCATDVACMMERVYACEGNGCTGKARTTTGPAGISQLELCHVPGYRNDAIMCDVCEDGYEANGEGDCSKCPDRCAAQTLNPGFGWSRTGSVPQSAVLHASNLRNPG